MSYTQTPNATVVDGAFWMKVLALAAMCITPFITSSKYLDAVAKKCAWSCVMVILCLLIAAAWFFVRDLTLTVILVLLLMSFMVHVRMQHQQQRGPDAFTQV